GAQRRDVLLGLRVLALVGGRGVDDEAVGAGRDRARALCRLAGRVVAVDELPRARAEALGVERLNENRIELGPRRVAVGALHEDGLDAGGAGLEADRDRVA